MKKEKLTSTPRYIGLDLIRLGMEKYLSKKREGKMLHDPLAAMGEITFVV